jgi:hypothetical protein
MKNKYIFFSVYAMNFQYNGSMLKQRHAKLYVLVLNLGPAVLVQPASLYTECPRMVLKKKEIHIQKNIY